MKLPVLITAVLLALIAPLVAAEVYKVVDENGKVTYTDRPPASSADAPLTLPPLNTQPGIQPAAPQEEAPQPQATAYQRVEILQPRPGLTVPPGQLDLVVQVDIEPELQAGHLVSIRLNGTPIGRPAATTQVRIDTIETVGIITMRATCLKDWG